MRHAEARRRKTYCVRPVFLADRGGPEPRLVTGLPGVARVATTPEFVYRDRWRAGGLVIWNNRCTLHRGRRFDETQPHDLCAAQHTESALDQAVQGT